MSDQRARHPVRSGDVSGVFPSVESPTRLHGLPSKLGAPSLAVVSLAMAAFTISACGGEEPAARATPSANRTDVVSMSPRNDSGWMGSLMIAPAGDRITIKLELLGLKEGEDYPAHLHRGSCEGGGPVVTELEPLGVNQLGLGSSSTVLDAGTLEEGTSYFVQAHLPDGTPAACADLPPRDS